MNTSEYSADSRRVFNAYVIDPCLAMMQTKDQ